MKEFVTMSDIDEATHFIMGKSILKPRVGMILGSGLGDIAELVNNPVIINTSEIPHWPSSTVTGHKGRLVIGELSGTCVLVLQGRAHYYEGYSISQVGLPVRVMHRLGIHSIIVTNATAR